MKFDKFFRALGPIVAVAMAAGLTACDGNVSINGEKGKPLAEIDLTGTPPEELVLLGPDEVRIIQGDKLAITVEGDQAVTDKLRFTLKDGTLGVLREGKSVDTGDGKAVVNVTMPAPKTLTMAGSGKINSAALARNAKVTIAGSGDIETPNVASDKLDLTIAGSGSYRGAGNVGALDVSIVGSGSAAMDALKTDKADLTIAGSGNSTFASDGEVKAKIMGSGSVTVRGRARCTVESMGSGKLVCEPGSAAAPAAEKAG
ncbi:MAG: hypothetical protein RL339_1027 [Pseudomonadota bacterium]|jgi:hypothetical protein